MTRHTVTLGLFLLAGAALVACVKPPGYLARRGDAAVDASVDATPLDAGADASTALRHLVPRTLFGDMPVDNRFIDPTFARVDQYGWLPAEYTSYDFAWAVPIHQRTPTGASGLAIRRTGGASSAPLMGSAKSASGPIRVSIWFGVAAGSEITAPQVRLLGMYPDGGASVDLAPDEDTPNVTLDGVLWTWWKADLDQGPVAWATLRILHRDDPPLYLNGPVLVRAGAGVKARSSWRPTMRKSFTAEERENFAGYWSAWRDRF